MHYQPPARVAGLPRIGILRTSLFGHSPKFAPDCGWWHHASGGKVDPLLEKRARKEEAMSTNPQDRSQPSVVLVHGGFVDGSGWQGVYSLLKDSYSVRIVQNPTISLEGDVAAAKMIIGQQSEPVILVGHSYGGAVITEAGNDPKVAALVYIAAFVPDQGKSVETIIGNFPPGSMMPPILPPQDGFLFLDGEKMPASFAGDLSAEEAEFMADSQVPWGVEALSGTISEAAWQSKPSWYLVATEDGMIPRRPSARGLSERVLPLRRPRAAMRSMCRSRQPWVHSSKRPLPK